MNAPSSGRDDAVDRGRQAQEGVSPFATSGRYRPIEDNTAEGPQS